ncbi:transcription factor SPT20 homolog [Ornithodoros turicata]|uniref:transcription factor SPT20 homolog n=1 Tax=Ornithodoros turicata TaxID=34597 RepID=UPI003139E19D
MLENTRNMNPTNPCFQHAGQLIQMARQQPGKLCRDPKKERLPSLQQKLLELYLSESNFNLRNRSLLSGSNLLQKLVAKEKLNCLVLNLYPGNEGYSLMLKSRTGIETETIRLPYEESELLQYIDNEELPPILVDLLERSQAPVFYSGSIIVEVRDYRRSSPSLGNYDAHYVLLKPTTQSVICDVGLIASDGQSWSMEDKLYLEATVVMATAEPLCLEPSVSVAVVSNWLQHRKGRLCTNNLQRMARRHSQVALNRRRKLEHFPAPPHLKAHEFITQYRKRAPRRSPNLSPSKQLESWKPKKTPLAVPQKIEVEKFATVKEKPELTSDNTPVVVQEYIMETEKGSGKMTHVTILQRPTDQQYFGKLYVDRDGQKNGTSCEFNLGSQVNVNRYLNQFREIFTEEGRKAVKITHLVPGRPPVVNHTHGARNTTEVASTKEIAESISSSASTTSTMSDSSSVCLVDQRGKPTTLASGLQVPAASSEESCGVSRPTTVECSPPPTNQAPLSHASLAPSTVNPHVTALPEPTPPVGLSGLGITQNVGLHNLVSLTRVNLSSGLPVPISLTMVPVTQSSMLVGTAAASPMPLQGQISEQAVSGAVTTATSTNVATLGSPQVIVSSGMVNPATNVLTTAAGMLSVPLTALGPQALAAQLVASGLKGTTHNVSSATPLSLLQVSGPQQSMPLISALPRPVTHTPTISPAVAGTATTIHPQHLQMALQKQIQQQMQQAQNTSSAQRRPRNRKKSSMKPQ